MNSDNLVRLPVTQHGIDGVLQRIRSCRIVVIGDLMVDEYLWGHIERISPEAPVPVLNLVRKETSLGGAGNAVKNLASLGAMVTVLGVVGKDAAGERILDELE